MLFGLRVSQFQDVHRVAPRDLSSSYDLTLRNAHFCSRLLDLVPKHVDFIALSFTIRIVEALGASAATTAAFAITASVFPDSVATTFVSHFTLCQRWFTLPRHAIFEAFPSTFQTLTASIIGVDMP